MHTDHIKELLPDYALQRLASSAAGLVEQHLRTCGECSRALEEVQSALALIGASQRPTVAPGYFSTVLPRVRRRLEQKPLEQLSSYLKNWPLGLPSLAAILLVILFAHVIPPSESVTAQHLPFDLATSFGSFDMDNMNARGISGDELGEIITDAGLTLTSSLHSALSMDVEIELSDAPMIGSLTVANELDDDVADGILARLTERIDL